MGQKFFGVDIQKEVAKAMPASALPNFVFTKHPLGTRNNALLTGGSNIGSVPITVGVWGAIADFNEQDITDGGEIQKGDIMIVIIAKPLEDLGLKIELSDTITDGILIYDVVKARQDGARATWRCRCRG